MAGHLVCFRCCLPAVHCPMSQFSLLQPSLASCLHRVKRPVFMPAQPHSSVSRFSKPSGYKFQSPYAESKACWESVSPSNTQHRKPLGKLHCWTECLYHPFTFYFELSLWRHHDCGYVQGCREKKEYEAETSFLQKRGFYTS